MSFKERIEEVIEDTLKKEFGISLKSPLKEPEESFGDYSTPVLFALEKNIKMDKNKLRERLLHALQSALSPIVEKIEFVKGFINITLRNSFLNEVLLEIVRNPEGYGRSELGLGTKINIEFVSANPTGPLHVANARAAAVGDTLARILKEIGFNVTKEYYVNDRGGQIDALEKSIAWRLGELGELPEDGYIGDYLLPIVKEIQEKKIGKGERGSYAAKKILESQLETLRKFRVEFDVITFESSIRDSVYPERILKLLDPYLQRKEGALYFKSSFFGDEKDRVLIKSDNEPTYFFYDLAYHLNKAERNFDHLINLWGPDHHGYIPRIRAGLKALGVLDNKKFDVLIVQQVTFLRGGEAVRMSKRKGEFFTMDELIEEVGVDPARFFFLTRSVSTPLEFDIDLAKKLSSENPVYYIQYVHARTCSLIDFAKEKGLSYENGDPCLLSHPLERRVMRKLLYFPDVIQEAATKYEPHLLCRYLMELSSLFHNYYQKVRIVTDEKEISEARLLLAVATNIVVKKGLYLMGVDAPERM